MGMDGESTPDESRVTRPEPASHKSPVTNSQSHHSWAIPRTEYSVWTEHMDIGGMYKLVIPRNGVVSNSTCGKARFRSQGRARGGLGTVRPSWVVQVHN